MESIRGKANEIFKAVDGWGTSEKLMQRHRRFRRRHGVVAPRYLNHYDGI